MGAPRKRSRSNLLASATCAACLTVVLAVPCLASAAAGDLDPSFGRGGLTTSSYDSFSGLGPAQSRASVEIAGTLSNGTLITSGQAIFMHCVHAACISPTGGHFVSAYLPDGDLDSEFGSGGTVAVAQDFGTVSRVVSGDRIVSVGMSSNLAEIEGTQLDAKGAPVPSYGNAGVASIALPPSIVKAYSVEVAEEPDGSVIVGTIGYEDQLDSTPHLLLTRILPGGSQDAAFGDGGWEEEGILPLRHLTQLAVDSNGRILAAEQFLSNLIVRRYKADGSPDMSFGDAGALTLSPADAFVSDIEPGVAGDFFVARKGDEGTSVIHYLSSGAEDLTYGTGGATVPTRRIDYPSLEVDRSGRLLVYSGASILGRYLPEGTLDRSFAVRGWAQVTTGKDFGGSDIALSDASLAFAYGSISKPLATVGRYRLEAGSPDDLDADGVVDRIDRCPGLYGSRTGCPFFRGNLRLALQDGELVGSATSPNAACLPRKLKVTLYRLARGKPRRFATTRADRRGQSRTLFEFERPGRPGRYIAAISGRTRGAVGICAFRRSKPVRIS